MQYIFMQFGKLINVVLLSLFTLFSLLSGAGHKGILMRIVGVMLTVSLYLQMYAYLGDSRLLYLYMTQLASYAVLILLYRAIYREPAGILFNCIFLLISIGTAFLARLNMETAVKQTIISIFAFPVLLIIPYVIRRLKISAIAGFLLLAAGLVLLALPAVFGEEINGATNWFVIGGLKVQPSEFVKLTYVIGIASVLSAKASENCKKFNNKNRIAAITLMAALHVIILVYERDLGAALIFYVVFIFMLHHMLKKAYIIPVGIFTGAAAAYTGYKLFPHIEIRVRAFLDPIASYESGGYQTAQSLFAIGYGGWFGSGIGEGIPETIPVGESDFIFSVIVEESGAMFGICLILIYCAMFAELIRISGRVKTEPYSQLGIGFSLMLMLQTFLNIGGAVKLIPSTGVTLPLISAGGSSLVSMLIMFAVLQGVRGIEGRGADAQDLPSVKRIMRYTYLTFFAFLTLACRLTVIALNKNSAYYESAYNTRRELALRSITRGIIYSADGQILAQTVTSDEEEKRYYPYGEVFSHIVGRVGRGKTGIEALENRALSGSDIPDAEKLINAIYERKNPGNNVITTLNTSLQQAAYDAMGEYCGAVCILEPATGKILAMVSKSAYNPNTIDVEWDELNNDTVNAPLLNRALRGLYLPGSTFKILTLLEIIRENADYDELSYMCSGKTVKFGVATHCAGNVAHGNQKLKEAFANSCNCAFVEFGTEMEMTAFRELAEGLLFNKSMPGRLSTAVSEFVIDSNSEKSEYPRTVIGLGDTRLTPLHGAVMAAAIANGGVIMEPYVIERIESENGKILKEYTPTVYKSAMTQKEARSLTEYLKEVIKSGTAAMLSESAYQVAGKTGTAIRNEAGDEDAWFIGFAPADSPKIAVSILLENAGSGSKAAVPVAKILFEIAENERIIR